MSYDVVEVEIATRKVRVLATAKRWEDADAIVNLSVVRRGVERHFYKAVVAGSHQDGDRLK